jgi:hypothetical protein
MGKSLLRDLTTFFLSLQVQIGLAFSAVGSRKYLAAKYHEMIIEILGTRHKMSELERGLESIYFKIFTDCILHIRNCSV